MITRVVLGTNEEMLNVEDVQEVVQNTGEYIKRALTINIVKDESGQLPTVAFVENLLRTENALNSIKIYKKDIIETKVDETTNEEIKIYGDEYLESKHIEYSTIQSIIKHSNGSMISIVLISDPTDISGDRAKELERENQELKQQVNALNIAMAEIMGV